LEACHFPDRNCSNCRIENLRWDTSKANAIDRQIHGTQCNGSRQHLAKLSEAEIVQIRELAKSTSFVSIAKNYGVTAEAISAAVRKLTWKHVK
jgi:hypothetical protein